jgi:uncharacterized protein
MAQAGSQPEGIDWNSKAWQAVQAVPLVSMVQIGTPTTLSILHDAPQGLYLDGAQLGEILLPRSYVTPAMVLGQKVKVFVYRDSEDRLVATTVMPMAFVGDIAVLTVRGVHPKIGAFLDWGLPKDLLLPYREQAGTVEIGDTVVAFVYLDPRTDRILASTKLGLHLPQLPHDYKKGQAVQLLIAGRTPLGYNAIIEGKHLGLLFESLSAGPQRVGDEVTGFINGIREDGKLDLSLESSSQERVGALTDLILAELAQWGGELALDDDSPPEIIRARFGASKKAFKQALGSLYKQRKIVFTRPGIGLADQQPQAAAPSRPLTPQPGPQPRYR